MRLFSLIVIIVRRKKERKKRKGLVSANSLTSDSIIHTSHGREFMEQENGQKVRRNMTTQLMFLRIYWMFWKISG